MKKYLIAIIVLVVLGVLLLNAKRPLLGATTPSTGIAGWFSESLGSQILFLGGAVTGYNSGTNVQLQASQGACNTGTSTLFAFKSPFAATSTLIFGELYGTQGATTTDIVVGTSTTPALALTAATTTLNENYMGIASIATSSQFFSVAGDKLGSSLGYNNPAGTPVAGAAYITNQSIVLGPNDYLLGFSTSTYVGATTGGNVAGNVAIPSSCTYKFIWASN